MSTTVKPNSALYNENDMARTASPTPSPALVAPSAKGITSPARQPVSLTFNEDCMLGMARYPDKFFDLAIVDPDYGLNEKISNGGTWAAKYKKEDGFLGGKPSSEYFNELFRVSANQIIWGGNYFELPPSRCFLIWDKIAELETLADCEFAWTSFDKNAKKFSHARNTSEKRIHISQKPIALYKWLLTNYAKPGDKILDTHLGSGSSRIAAYDLGFDFYAWELDADYFAAQEKRFKNFISQPKLFTPEKQQTKQSTMF